MTVIIIFLNMNEGTSHQAIQPFTVHVAPKGHEERCEEIPVN